MAHYVSKLTEDEQLQVCRWLGEFHTPVELSRLVKKEFQKQLSQQNFSNYLRSKRWRPVIDRLRSEWIAGVMDIPIAHKRARIERLAKYLEEAEADTKLKPWMKRRQCLHILDQARLEMDERRTDVTNIYMTQINQASDDELIRRRDELIERLRRYRPAVTQQGGQDGNRLGHGGEVLEAPADTGAESNGGSH